MPPGALWLQLLVEQSKFAMQSIGPRLLVGPASKAILPSGVPPPSCACASANPSAASTSPEASAEVAASPGAIASETDEASTVLSFESLHEAKNKGATNNAAMKSKVVFIAAMYSSYFPWARENRVDDYYRGSTTLPKKRIAPELVSLIVNRNGRST